ncbi:hypothetical protein FQA39_LY19180 [Lamprigera yunnana]|nr:hypothetical protein FQA39_LY19180 [Lamprigera yunnana]
MERQRLVRNWAEYRMAWGRSRSRPGDAPREGGCLAAAPSPPRRAIVNRTAQWWSGNRLTTLAQALQGGDVNALAWDATGQALVLQAAAFTAADWQPPCRAGPMAKTMPGLPLEKGVDGTVKALAWDALGGRLFAGGRLHTAVGQPPTASPLQDGPGAMERRSTEATRTDTGVTGNAELTATFVASNANTYTLTYTAGANGTITGTSTQTVGQGASGTAVTAVPDPGYRFDQWSDGNTNATRTDGNATADISVTASFVIDTTVSPASAIAVPALGVTANTQPWWQKKARRVEDRFANATTNAQQPAITALAGAASANAIAQTASATITAGDAAALAAVARQLQAAKDAFVAKNQHFGAFSIDVTPAANQIDIKVTGTSAHGSRPEEGVNPVPRLALFLQETLLPGNGQALVQKNQYSEALRYINGVFGMDYLPMALGRGVCRQLHGAADHVAQPDQARQRRAGSNHQRAHAARQIARATESESKKPSPTGARAQGIRRDNPHRAGSLHRHRGDPAVCHREDAHGRRGQLVLGSLALTGLVTTNQAFSGFSNSATITVAAMFILAGGGPANQRCAEWDGQPAGQGQVAVSVFAAAVCGAGGGGAVCQQHGGGGGVHAYRDCRLRQCRHACIEGADSAVVLQEGDVLLARGDWAKLVALGDSVGLVLNLPPDATEKSPEKGEQVIAEVMIAPNSHAMAEPAGLHPTLSPQSTGWRAPRASVLQRAIERRSLPAHGRRADGDDARGRHWRAAPQQACDRAERTRGAHGQGLARVVCAGGHGAGDCGIGPRLGADCGHLGDRRAGDDHRRLPERRRGVRQHRLAHHHLDGGPDAPGHCDERDGRRAVSGGQLAGPGQAVWPACGAGRAVLAGAGADGVYEQRRRRRAADADRHIHRQDAGRRRHTLPDRVLPESVGCFCSAGKSAAGFAEYLFEGAVHSFRGGRLLRFAAFQCAMVGCQAVSTTAPNRDSSSDPCTGECVARCRCGIAVRGRPPLLEHALKALPAF